MSRTNTASPAHTDTARLAPGCLYLIPSPLDFSCAQAGDIRAALPEATLLQAARLTDWIVENAKSARAVLGRIAAVHPLAQSLQSIQIQEMPRAMHKKGDHGAAADFASLAREWLAPLLLGRDMGLMCEAGMPAIADPGSSIVRAAHAMGVQVMPMVGPSSLFLAWAASGLHGQNFSFVGYLPQETTAREKRLRELQQTIRTNAQSVSFIETPYRNAALFQSLLSSLAPQTLLAVSAGLGTPQSYSATRSIVQWRAQGLPQQVLELPCVWMIGQ